MQVGQAEQKKKSGQDQKKDINGHLFKSKAQTETRIGFYMRIAGVNIPNDKKIWVSMAYIYGVGTKNSRVILEALGIDANKRTKDLTETESDKIRDYLDKNYKIEGDLRSEVAQNIKRLREIGTYRGMRHSRNLPVRGQRTKTNARTKRGRRVTVGSGRKAAAEKT